MIITAYKSTHDGKLFEDKAKYVKHLRKIAAERRYDRKIQKINQDRTEFLRKNFWEGVKSPDQLVQALKVHAEWIGLNGLANERFYTKKRPPGPPLFKSCNLSLHYSDQVSNTHSCPHNGVTNWNQAHNRRQGLNLPEGYPGLRGRLDYKVEWYSAWEGWYPGGSDMWKDTRVHTGTGGGGGFKAYETDKTKGLQSFGYDVTLFFDDWPGLKQAFDQARMWLILQEGEEVDIQRVVKKMNEMFTAESYEFRIR